MARRAGIGELGAAAVEVIAPRLAKADAFGREQRSREGPVLFPVGGPGGSFGEGLFGAGLGVADGIQQLVGILDGEIDALERERIHLEVGDCRGVIDDMLAEVDRRAEAGQPGLDRGRSGRRERRGR